MKRVPQQRSRRSLGFKKPKKGRRRIWMLEGEPATNITVSQRTHRTFTEGKKLLDAATISEAARRMSRTAIELIQFQRSGGQIVLCKDGMPDRVVWFV